MYDTYDDIVEYSTLDYLKAYQGGTPNEAEAKKIASEVLSSTQSYVETHNATEKERKWKMPHSLLPQQVGMILVHLHNVVNIDLAMVGQDTVTVVGVYKENGPDRGIYSTVDRDLNALVRWYKFTATTKDIEEVRVYIRDYAEVKTVNQNPDLIPCENGIFDYREKVLSDFTPDTVFLTKSPIDFNPNAKNVVIHNPADGTDWDVESWMSDFYDDADTVELLWQVIGAGLRPLVRWDKAAWFYSVAGNNGKGTLIELMRQLCGRDSTTSIPLADMGKDFMLAPLIRANVILTDENDVGTYIDKAANLKAIITQDVLTINRKFKDPIPMRAHIFMVQCLNEMPKVKDTSQSWYRRQLFIPFTKCFTGAERKYIKNDYIRRKEVLEYVMYRVLMGMDDYYDLTPTMLCDNALQEYKEYNDPIRQFVSDVLPKCVWDMLPFNFLYDLYRGWYKASIGDSMCVSRTKFRAQLIPIIRESTEWLCVDSEKTYRVHVDMASTPEPLIDTYEATKWMNKLFMSSSDWRKRCIPGEWSDKYKGIIRVGGSYDK